MMTDPYYQLIDELNASAKAGFIDNIIYKNDKRLQKITVHFSRHVTTKQLNAIHKHLKEKYGTTTIVIVAIDPNSHNTLLMYVYEPINKKQVEHESP
jgi:hypothetical protein